jgi:hypothetical protein
MTDEKLCNKIKNKANREDLENTLVGKMDTSQVKNIIDQKANATDFESIKHQIRAVLKELDSKASMRDLKSHSDYTKVTIEDLTKQVLLKSNMKDVVMLMDEKTS